MRVHVSNVTFLGDDVHVIFVSNIHYGLAVLVETETNLRIKVRSVNSTIYMTLIVLHFSKFIFAFKVI